MKTYFSLIFAIFVFYSCGSSSKSSGSSATYVNPHATMHQEMHQELYKEELKKEFEKLLAGLSGKYMGTVPCSDCEGVEIELQLNVDMSYSYTQRRLGVNTMEKSFDGNYTLGENFIIQLDNTNIDFRYFQKDEGQLKVLDKNAKVVAGELGNRYVLKPFLGDIKY